MSSLQLLVAIMLHESAMGSPISQLLKFLVRAGGEGVVLRAEKMEEIVAVVDLIVGTTNQRKCYW